MDTEWMRFTSHFGNCCTLLPLAVEAETKLIQRAIRSIQVQTKRGDLSFMDRRCIWDSKDNI